MASNTILLSLSQGYISVIDEDDSDLSAWKWTAVKETPSLIYARRNVRKSDGTLKSVRLHRLILGRMMGFELSREQKVDHKDGNGLNNHRDNLRLASSVQNGQNARVRTDNISGVSGVNWHKAAGKWQARIQVEKKLVHLGLFPEFKDAVKARKEAELEYFKEFSPILCRGEK